MNQLFRNIALALCFVFVGVATEAQAATLYAVIVGDTDAYDVRPFVEQNVRLVREEMAKVAQYTGLELKEMVFVDEKAKGSFIEDLDKLEVKADDVIVFYWNGHGVNVHEKGGAWPSLVKTADDRVVDHLQVTQMLMRKNPKFLLSVAASCNSVGSDVRIEKRVSPFGALEADEALVAKNYRKLFLESTGTLMASSSSPGEYSWVNPEEGGEYYTLALLDNIHGVVKSEKGVAWEVVLDQATAEVTEVQTPHYKFISKDRV